MTDVNTVDIDTATDIGAVGQRLVQARDSLTAAERSLAIRAPSLAELHAAVDGAIQVSSTAARNYYEVISQLSPAHAPVQPRRSP